MPDPLEQLRVVQLVADLPAPSPTVLFFFGGAVVLEGLFPAIIAIAGDRFAEGLQGVRDPGPVRMNRWNL